MDVNHELDDTNKEEINETENENFEKNVKNCGKKDTQIAEKENINNNI